MTNVHDVAAYILKKQGEMTTMKLQKLVYYCQAWSLVWDEERLFREKIEAWTNGPVIPALYNLHRGQFKVREWTSGDPRSLSAKQIETVDSVLKYYGEKTSQWLSDLTHSEDPWRNSRIGVPDTATCRKEITPAAMHEYYSGLRDK